jgi:hypothetical protein
LGHELRRPEADFLRDGVYELRISLNHIQYRLLYCFHTGTEPDRTEGTKAVGAGPVTKRPAAKKQSGGPPARQVIAVVAHGITKEDKVPHQEIDRALGRMRKFVADPVRHTYAEG